MKINKQITKRSFSNFFHIFNPKAIITDIIIGFQRLIIIDLHLFELENEGFFFSKLINKILRINDEDYIVLWFVSDDEMVDCLDDYLTNSSSYFLVLIG